MVTTNLAHVSLGCEDNGFQAVICVRHFFLLDDIHESGEDLSIRELGVAEHRTAGLDGLWTETAE